jgi:hypothetical protein
MSGCGVVAMRMFDDFELDDGWRVDRSCVRTSTLKKRSANGGGPPSR